MAKTVLLDVLEKTIGQYVVNLDVNSLNVSIWKGRVELHSLELDVDAVNEQLSALRPPPPFRAKSGKFDSFQIVIPWRHLMSQPVSFKANGLSIELEPHQFTQNEQASDPTELSEQDAIKARRKSIEKAEAKRLQLNAFRIFLQETEKQQEGGVSKKATHQKVSFGSKLLRTILENLEISIHNIHVSLSNEQVNIGVVLRSCELFKVSKPDSTDASSSSKHPRYIEKSFEMEGLAVYINDQTSLSSHQIPLDFDWSEGNEIANSFVLRPLTIKANFQQSDDQLCLEHPRYTCSTEVESMKLIFSKRQIELVHNLLSSTKHSSPVKRGGKRQPVLFPQYRPYCRLGENDPRAAKEWWNYAFLCVRRLRRKKLWDEALEMFRHRQRYIKLYQRRLFAPTPQPSKSRGPKVEALQWVLPLTHDDELRLDNMELNQFIPVPTLMNWRDIAEARMTKETEKMKTIKTWPSQLKTTILNEDEMRALEFEFWRIEEEANRLSAESKLYNVSFTLLSLQVCIKQVSAPSMIATLQINRITTGLETSVGGRMRSTFNMNALSLKYHVPGTRSSKIIDSNPFDGNDDVLSVVFEHGSSNENHVSVRLKSIEISAVPSFLVEMRNMGTFGAQGARDSSSPRQSVKRDDEEGIEKPFVHKLIKEWRIREVGLQEWSMDVEIDQISLSLFDATENGVEIKLTQSTANIEVLSNKIQKGSLAFGSFVVEHIHDSLRQYMLKSSVSSTVGFDKSNGGHDSVSYRQGSVRIDFVFSPLIHIGKKDPFREGALYSDDVKCKKLLNITIAGLSVFWNPAQILDVKSNLTSLLRLLQTQKGSKPSTKESKIQLEEGEEEGGSSIVIHVSVVSLSLWLMSSIDNQPLFHLKIPQARTSCCVKSGAFFLNIDLDNLALETPPLGSTHPENRRLLGPTDEETSHAIQVQVAVGRYAVGMVQSASVDGEDCHLVVAVTISSGFIAHYLHSHIMGFVTYLRRSILALVLPPPKQPKNPRKKLIVVRAPEFEVKVPEKSTEKSCMILELDSVEVKIFLKPPTSRIVRVLLSGINITDFGRDSILERPIKGISCTIDIPPRNTDVSEDSEISISTNVSTSSFYILKEQYDCLMSLLKGNIRESRLFLRAEDDSDHILESPLTPITPNWPKRAVKVNVSIDNVSVSLVQDKNVKMMMGNASSVMLDLHLVRQKETSEMSFRLENFVLHDRKQQRLIGSSKPGYSGTSIHLSLESVREKSKQTNLTLESVEFVFIPDVVSDLAQFLKTEQLDTQGSPARRNQSSNTQQLHSPMVGEIGFSLDAPALNVVFVDLGKGSQQDVQHLTRDKIVLGTSVEASYLSQLGAEMTPSTRRLSVDANDFEFHSVIESTQLSSQSIQVVEPFSFGVRVSSESFDTMKPSVEFKLAIDSKVELYLSLRQYGLAETILASIADHFKNDTSTEVVSPMTESDARRIQRLDAALKSIDGTSIQTFQNSLLERVDKSKVEIKKDTPIWTIAVSLSLKEVELLVVNDLKDLQDPLLRLAIVDTVGSAQIQQGQQLLSGTQSCTFFDCDLVTSIMAEYFEARNCRWQKLLHPWEIMVSAGRKQSGVPNKSQSSLDIQAFPCAVEFSDSLLLRLNEARALWTAYADSKSKLIHSMEGPGNQDVKQAALAKLSRALLHSRPIVFENQSGFEVEFEYSGSFGRRERCADRSTCSFEFEHPRATEASSERSSDKPQKYVKVYIQGESIVISGVDQAPLDQKQAHELSTMVLFSQVCLRKNSKIIVLSGGFEVHNKTRLSLALGVVSKDDINSTGADEQLRPPLQDDHFLLSPEFSSISLPAQSMNSIQEGWKSQGETSFSVVVRVYSGNLLYWETVSFDLNPLMFDGKRNVLLWRGEIMCCTTGDSSNKRDKIRGACVLRGKLNGTLVDGQHIAFDFFLEPRAKLKSHLQIPVTVRSTSAHLYSPVTLLQDGGLSVHQIDTQQFIDIHSSASEISFSAKPTGNPSHGTQYDWTNEISLPLDREGFQTPRRFHFPASMDVSLVGAEFFVSFGTPTSFGRARNGKQTNTVSDFSKTDEGDELMYFLSMCSYVIDHTRDVVVARASTAQSPTVFTSPQVKDPPFLYGAYASTKHSWLISPVPASAQKLQLVWSGRTSKPFSIDEVAIFEGGVGCTPVKFEDGGEIHLFMYRRIPDAYQCEIHVVPSHVIFNCSKKYSISVHEKNGRTLEIKPQTFAKLSASSDGRFVVKVECQEVGVATSSIEVGRLGTRIAIVWEAESIPAGSVSIETSLGSVDSHMVTKVGKIQLGSRANDVFEKAERFGAVEDDIIWGRIELSQFTLSMSGSKMPTLGDSANLVRDSEDSHEKICTLELKKMKFEGSKVFQNDQHASNGSESQFPSQSER